MLLCPLHLEHACIISPTTLSDITVLRELFFLRTDGRATWEHGGRLRVATRTRFVLRARNLRYCAPESLQGGMHRGLDVYVYRYISLFSLGAWPGCALVELFREKNTMCVPEDQLSTLERPGCCNCRQGCPQAPNDIVFFVFFCMVYWYYYLLGRSTHQGTHCAIPSLRTGRIGSAG